MYAIEFEADIQNGVVKIPPEYARLRNIHARVVVMVGESKANAEIMAFSRHSANAIEEWQDEAEDDVWT